MNYPRLTDNQLAAPVIGGGIPKNVPVVLLLLAPGSVAGANDFSSLRADRAAIEHVYYNHRLGEKPPFEQVLPPNTLEHLVRQDLRKEAALKKIYAVETTPALLDAEGVVERQIRRVVVMASRRAPRVLAAAPIRRTFSRSPGSASCDVSRARPPRFFHTT